MGDAGQMNILFVWEIRKKEKKEEEGSPEEERNKKCVI